MKSLPQKRILTLILIILLVISPITLFLFPSNAHAVVPVLDSENLFQNTLTAGYLRALVEKEVGVTGGGAIGKGAKAIGSAVSILKGGGTGAVGNAVSALTGGGTGSNAVTNAISALTGGKSMDAIAWAAANIAIEAITRSAIDWINHGFEGGPVFVTDLRGFLLDLADAETSIFIERLGLADLCSPWSLDIRIALSLPTSQFEREVACTLSDIVANMDAFINGDFSQGGWAGWFELTTKPQNNPYGLYLMTASELDQRIAGTQQEQTQLLSFGSGFFSQTKCEEIPLAPGQTGPNQKRCKIVNPGVVIEEQLNNTLFGGQRRLEVADEVNEIVSALFGQLINKILGGSSGGLRGLSEGSYGRPSYTSQLGNIDDAGILQGVKDKFISEIDVIIKSETGYKNIKQNTLSAITASEILLLNLQVCYAEKLADLSLNLTSSEKSLAQTRIDNTLITIATQITPTKTLLENDITSADQNLTTLNTLRNDIPNATSLEQLEIPSESFSTLLQGGSLNGTHTAITFVQAEQSTITAQMSALDTTTNTQIAECQVFPPPPQQQNP